MTRLTQKELRILEHPPTPKTWRCRKCTMVNAGRSQKCLICAKPKGRTPKLLWPEYVAACKRAGIEPDGKPYHPNRIAPTEQTSPRKRRGRKRG